MIKFLSRSRSVPALLLLLPLLFVLGHPIQALAGGGDTNQAGAPTGAVAEDVYTPEHSFNSGLLDQANSVRGFGLPAPTEDEPPAPAEDPPDSQTDTVATAAELQAWFDVHRANGGTVALEADIWLYGGDSLDLNYTNGRTPLTIEAGVYHIYISGGALSLSGYIEIFGEGANAPLISEVAKGQISITDGVSITAQGADSSITGRCALSLFGGAELRDLYVVSDSAQAVGIHFKDDGTAGAQQASITNCSIFVYGDNATAVWSEIPFTAVSSYIIARGNNVTSIDAPSFKLTGTEAQPAPKPADNTAANLDELKTWLEYYRDIGGEVTLTGNIYVPEGEFISTCAEDDAPITIDAQGYSIFLQGGYFSLTGPISITGGAGDYPLIYDPAGSDLVIGDGLSVTARQRGAVYCSAAAQIDGVNIAASGAGVVALYVAGASAGATEPIHLYRSKITAAGAGASAIVSNVPLSAVLCVITAGGNSAQSIIAPDIALYCSQVLPQPASCRVDEKSPLPADGRNILEVPVGYPAEQITLPDQFYCSIGEELYSYAVKWDAAAVDTSTEGEYQVSGAITGDSPDLPPLASEIGVKPPEPVFTVKVSAPRKPAFDESSVAFSPWRASLSVDFAEPIDASAAAFYMWDDGQKQWRDITAETGLGINNTTVYNIPNIYNGLTYGFKIVCGGDGLIRGESNELWVQITDNIALVVDTGGDRTGTDRGEVKTPEDNHDNSSENSDGDNSGDANHGSGAPGAGSHSGSTTPSPMVTAPHQPNQPGSDAKTGPNATSARGFGIQAAEASVGAPPAGLTQPPGSSQAIGAGNVQSRNWPGNQVEKTVLSQAGLSTGLYTGLSTDLSPDKGPAAPKPETDTSGASKVNPAETNQKNQADTATANRQPTGTDRQSPITTGQSAPAPAFNIGAAIGISLGVAALLALALLWIKQRGARR